MTSFQDILSKPMEDIKAPKPLPIGSYTAIVNGQPEITKKGKNNTDCVVFPLKLIQAASDVNQGQLVEALEGKTLQDVKLNHTMWVTADSAFRFKQFMTDVLGITASNLGEAIAQAPGRQLIVNIGHYISNKEGEAPTVGMEIKSTAKAG